MSTRYFKKAGGLHLLHSALGSIASALNLGFEGVHGTVTVSASKRGFAIKLNGKTLAKGKNADEFENNYKAAVEKAAKGG